MIDGRVPPDQHKRRRAASGMAGAVAERQAPDRAQGGPAAASRSGALGTHANYSSALATLDREELRSARFDLRKWARKAALFGAETPEHAHRVATCGWATAGGVSGVGIRATAGTAGFAGLQSCGSVWVCPSCAAKVAARRANELGRVLGWARTEGHSLAMVTLTVSHRRNDTLQDVWDAVGLGWGAVTSGSSWASETEAAYGKRLAGWYERGEEYNAGLRDRAPKGWKARMEPQPRIGDLERYSVLGWARAVEVTRGANGWHVHIHAVMVFDGKEDAHHRAFDVGRGMRDRWNRGIEKKGFTSSIEHGVRIDVSEGAEKKLAEYLAKSLEPEKVVKASVEKAGRDLAREATLGQHKKARNGGRSPFQILAELKDGDAEDWALWVEWMHGSMGRQQLTWSRDLRKMAGMIEEEKTDQDIADEEFGSEQDTILMLPVESWKQVRNSPQSMAKILALAEKNPRDLQKWLDREGIPWVPFTASPEQN